MATFLDFDFETLARADADRSRSLRGYWRIGRRAAKRCWLNQQTIRRERVFCQNSGGCGSTYLIQLLNANGVPEVFHEKTPDLLEYGLDHFERGLSKNRLIRLLRYTRHDVFVEANNRLFALSNALASAFPRARFLHLHRDAAESIRSSLSKENVDQYLRRDIRFRGSLAGPHGADPFTRMCHHWANMNCRICDDLDRLRRQGRVVAELRFEDLIAGRLEPLESVLGRELKTRSVAPANVRPVRKSGRFPTYSDWNERQKKTFETICGPVMARLGGSPARALPDTPS